MKKHGVFLSFSNGQPIFISKPVIPRWQIHVYLPDSMFVEFLGKFL